MSLPESTKAYLNARDNQRTALLRDSYRAEAAKQQGSSRAILAWHVSRLEEYCQRVLLLAMEIKKNQPTPFRAMLTTDAFTCVHIASSEVSAMVASFATERAVVATLANNLNRLLDTIASASCSEEVVRESIEWAYSFGVVIRHQLSIEDAAGMMPSASLPHGMENVLEHRARQVFNSGVLLSAQIEGISAGIAVCRNAC